MSRKDNLVKSRSIYTLRTKHMTVPNGTIYENDHITIINNDGIFDDDIPLFSDSNFKFRISKGSDGKRKHSRGGFTQLDNGNGNVWTLKNLPEVKKSTDGEIALKCNYSSLKDFAYYGSAVELIKGTVNDIVMRYPGGLYYYQDSIAPRITINNVKYVAISNEFNIDFWSPVGCNADEADNPLRILGASYLNYVNKDNNTINLTIEIQETKCPNTIIGKVDFGFGPYFSIYVDELNDKYLLVTEEYYNRHKDEKVIIKPKKKFFDEFWASIDDFEKVLLNRNSKPLYKAVLESPFIENGKHRYEYLPFIWPTIVDDVPDVSSGIFGGYINSLLKIAEYYDEYDSDNIWRMMTHESIKNLDYTFGRVSDGEEIETTDIDFSRMNAMLKIYGRLFDDIKRYADGIKHVNSITYDEKDNLPDYFLSDVVELGGFEAKSINKLQKYSGGTDMCSYDCFSGMSVLSVFEVNGEFLKRFSLNEHYINSEKGTKRGIQSVLGLFGYHYVSGGNLTNIGDYSMDEYIRVAHYFPNYMEMSLLRSLIPSDYEYPEAIGENNNMDGYPVAIVSPNYGSGNDEDLYLIPWVDNGTKYADNIYFQEKGGWGKTHKKDISLGITSATMITDRYPDFCLDLYGETKPYLTFVNDIDELTSLSNNVVYDGMVCYVTDITKIYTTYSAESDYHTSIIEDNTPNTPTNDDDETPHTPINDNEDEIIFGASSDTGHDIGTDHPASTVRDYSHYFILYNSALSTHVGFVNNDFYSCYGWKNILNSEFNGESPTTLDGLKVLYLESMELESKGNNPHCGYGNYDNGDSYIEKLNRIFGTEVDNGDFDYIKNDPRYVNDYLAICTSGFSISGLVVDNRKCYYFENNNGGIVYRTNNDDSVISDSRINDVLDGDYSKFINPEGDSINDEAASYSVVNVKNFKIKIKTDGNKHFETYLYDVVFKYLNEVIPSTTIFEYEFVGSENIIIPSGFETIEQKPDVVLNQIVADGVIVDDNTTYFIENNE